MGILQDMIHHEAERTFNFAGWIPRTQYKKWTDHWFKTAERIRDDFGRQGLPETMKAVEEIIAENRKIEEEINGRETKAE